MVKTCCTCKWYSDPFVSVCVNADSEHCADFVEPGETCEEWEEKDGD